MTSGKEDWSDDQTLTQYLGSPDILEAVARLGSSHRFYRSGNVLFWTGFETDDDTFTYYKPGVGDDLQIVSNKGLSGTSCLQASSGVNGQQVELRKVLPSVVSDYMAFSGVLDIAQLTSSVDTTLSIYTGTTLYTAGVRFNGANNRVSYLNSAGSFAQFADYTGNFVTPTEHWSPFKMWVNLTAGKYLKVDIMGTPYDLSSNDLYSEASTINPCVYLVWTLYGKTSSRNYGWLDNLSVTTFDPS